MAGAPVDERDDGTGSDSGFVVGRKKTDRKMVAWVAIIGMVLLVAYLFLTQGSDLGQAEADAAKAKAEAELVAKEYAASVVDPEAESRERLAEAKRALAAAKAERAKGAVEALLPPPSKASDFNLDRLNRAAEAIRKGPEKAPRVAQPGDAFLVYSADSTDEDTEGLSVAESLKLEETKEREAERGASPQAAPNTLTPEQIAAIDDPALRAKYQKIADAQERKVNVERLLAEKAKTINAPGGEGNAAWLTRRKNSAVQTITPIMAQRVLDRYWLAPGTTVSAVLQQGVNTQIPAIVTARVTQDVYDSRYGSHLVIPAGSVLKGTYNNAVSASQNRAMVVFDSLITPSGGIVNLAAMSASDQLGVAGVPGELHTHFWKRMGMATIFALEAVGISKLEEDKPVILESGAQTSTKGHSEGAKIMADAFNSEMQRRIGSSPYITIEPGAQISLVLASGISIPPIANTR